MKRLTRCDSLSHVLTWLVLNLLFEPIIVGTIFCIWRWQQGRLLMIQILGLRVDWERVGILQTLSTLYLPFQEQEQLLLDAACRQSRLQWQW